MSLISQSEISAALFCSSAPVISDIISSKRGWKKGFMFRCLNEAMFSQQNRVQMAQSARSLFQCLIITSLFFVCFENPKKFMKFPIWWGLNFIRNIFSCPDYCINHALLTLMKTFVWVGTIYCCCPWKTSSPLHLLFVRSTEGSSVPLWVDKPLKILNGLSVKYIIT